MLFGVLLPIVSRAWVSVVVALVGETLLAFAWLRDCRRAADGSEPGPDRGDPPV